MLENILLKIVQTWGLKELPEYRGFRCANCQKYMRKAWHHRLNSGGYKTPVHFCDSCQVEIKARGIYKNFTCDKCGKDMTKAWHVWNKKGGVLVETHFCKKCGEKLGFSKIVEKK